jgi:hypothetical protein
LNTPEFAFVNVKENHVTETPYPFHYFSRSCFGSLYYKEYKEVDHILAGMSVSRMNLEQFRETFLKIALFDIWLSNEDRNGNNYNLLFDINNNLFHYYPTKV